MNAILLYILKSVVWLSSFTLVFYLFLRKERFFRLNRFFLLSGIAASLIFPLITIRYQVKAELPVENVTISSGSVTAFTDGSSNPSDYLPGFLIVYTAGALLVAIIFILKNRSLFRALKRSSASPVDNVKLVHEGDYPGSFSFFSWVFINPSVSESETREIMNHEMVHVIQKHWIDLVLAELICIVQWFNPFSWIYFHFIRQNHEYLADEGALQRSDDPALYKAAILNQVMGLPVFCVSNSFNYSLTKKRFNMMKNIVSSPYRKLRMLFIVPVIIALLAAFAKPEYKDLNPADLNSDSQGNLFQDKSVKGIVLQQDGTPLDRATVVVKGTTIGTITDSKGVFTISNPPEGASLIVSYVGFSSRIVKPDFLKEMKIVMFRDTIKLGAVETAPPPPPPPPPFDLKEVAKTAVVIIDGKETKEDISKLNPDKLASVILWQDEAAIMKFGDKGKNGVLEIKTKKAAGVPEDEHTFYARPKVNKTIVDTVKSVNTGNIKAETVNEQVPAEKDALIIIEEMPSFPGGEAALNAWVSSNIKYPASAYKKQLSGQVIVIFVVRVDGTIGNVSVFKGVDPALDNEAVRVVSSMPRWNPGEQSGKKVDVYVKIPIDFKL